MNIFNLVRIILLGTASLLVVADYTFSVSRYPDTSIIGYLILSALSASCASFPPSKIFQLWYVRWVVCIPLAIVFFLVAIMSMSRA